MHIFRFITLLTLATCLSSAQTVDAGFAQHLVTATMSAHPELQKMGIHVTPPSGREDIIIACSVPSKIGKKSSANDLAVEQAGKPAVKTVTEGRFYDLALPLTDASHKNIGLLVMEMRFAGAASPEDAVAKSAAIRDHLATQIPSIATLFQPAPTSDPIVLRATTKLPDITGDFDHFAVDEKNDRLYVSAEVHHSIEVFNLKTGEHLRSAAVVTTPHTLAFVSSTGTLLVADGGDNSCRLFDAATLTEQKRIPLAPYPDAAVYDPGRNLFYVGNGGNHGGMDYSFVSIISPAEQKEIGRVRIESDNLEAMALDANGQTLYVNMRDKARIAVVDLAKREVRTVWTVEGLKLNTPMAIDAARHRLFVAGRQPGKLFVLNSDNGQVVQTIDAVEKADDMTFDAATRRIYLTGAGGVDVIRQDDPDHYSKLTEFDTNEGKTSVLVPSLRQFYIIHTKTAIDAAALQVYQVNTTHGASE